MAAHSTKVDWNLLTDEEEKREKKPRARTEVTTYIREKDGGAPGQMVRETVKLEKRVYPISRAAIERKNMRKFGDVKEVPLGTHLKGDFIQQEDLNIETMQCADKGEIDIVNKLSKINTESIKMRKDKERMELLQNVGSNANNTGAGAVAAAAAAAAAQAANDFIEVGDKSKKPKTIEQITFSHDSEEYTIEISNILSFFNAKNEDQILGKEDMRQQEIFILIMVVSINRGGEIVQALARRVHGKKHDD